MHTIEDRLGLLIDAVEATVSIDLDHARKQLRLLLFAESDPDRTGTTGDALCLLAERSTEYRHLTPAILRFLPVQGLIPESNPNNQIARSVVALASGSLPELCEFLGVSPLQQTFQNYSILRGAHDRICSLLAPLENTPTTLELLLQARHPVIECLNHSAVRAYCAPFGLSMVAVYADQVFALMRKIHTSDPTVLQHHIRSFMNLVDECNLIIGKRSNFLMQHYFGRLLTSAKAAVDSFLAEKRSRFAAPISVRLAQDGSIPKRYPLEENRQFVVLIPLRNSGPGTALNVQAQITHDPGDIVLGSTTTNVGAVAPGDFSVAFDILVISTTSKISMILTVTWAEMGSLEANSLIATVDICAQKLGVPWTELQYQHPYSTAVAKGDDFVGRREKVAALASKILRTPMESFFVTGQKRVGKTSLALAAADFAKTQSADIDYKYVLWGNIAYENPRHSVNALGNELIDFVNQTLLAKHRSKGIELDGSLAPVLPLFTLAQKLSPRRKYVIIVDEFDEIHPELYLQGALALLTYVQHVRPPAARRRHRCQ
jgi:hypothetical protein